MAPDRGGSPVIGVLGPVEIYPAGAVVHPGRLEAMLLAMLAAHAGRIVSTSRLVDGLWQDRPPSSARNRVQALVSGLRRALEATGARVGTRPTGYVLELSDDQYDAAAFERLVAEGRAAAARGDLPGAVRLLGDALQLWRGDAFEGVECSLVTPEAARLDGLRRAALEESVEARLAMGQHRALSVELTGRVAADPLREVLRGQLMVALYRSGRKAEALDVYRQGAAALADEHGLDPGVHLRRLRDGILVDDAALAPPSTPPSTPTAPTAPAAGAAARIPAQLPADVATFTGRAEQLRRLDTLLDDSADAPRAVVISAIEGSGGVGKSALAVHWARQVRRHFPDGQLYANLRGFANSAPLRPIEALARFLRALDVPAERVPVDVEEAAALYRSTVADRRVLVLLDDAHDPDQVRPLLPASPRSVVVVTSRHDLGGLVARDGAHRLGLGVLTPTESNELLTRLLGAERAGAEPEALARLAELCAHLPLALRIAAANLILRAQETIAAYVARLAGGDRLTALAVDGDPQAAVRATYDLSYANLPEPARRLFRRIGLVPGPDVTADVAAALIESTREEASHLLGRLVAAHLLDEVAGRYTCHDLLRQYAREQAMANDDDATRAGIVQRLLGFYLDAADRAANLIYHGKLRLPVPPAERRHTVAFVDDAHAVSWLDAERANLVAAITTAAAEGPRQMAWLLADTLRGYFHIGMHAVDWLTAAQAALAAAETDDEPRAQAVTHISLASLHWRRGDYDASIDHHLRAIAFAQRSGWLAAENTAINNLGTVYAELGRLADAARLLRQTLEGARRLGSQGSIAASLTNLGLTLNYLGRLDEALGHGLEALPLYRQAGSRNGEAITLGNLGALSHQLGRLDDGLAYLQQALAIHRDIGDPPAEAIALVEVADLHRSAGRYAEALRVGRSALTIARDVGRRRTQADALNAIAGTHDRTGEHRQAIELYHAALVLARQNTDQLPELVSLIGLTGAHRHLGARGEAAEHGERALALARRSGFRMHEGIAATVLARVRLDAGEELRAVEEAGVALTIHEETGHRVGEADALALLGDAVARLKGQAAALPYRRRALAIYEDVGVPEAQDLRALIGAAQDPA
jgi:DNA-binding SARP family transcriptional activator/Tfp pilus assembly protein PilF